MLAKNCGFYSIYTDHNGLSDYQFKIESVSDPVVDRYNLIGSLFKSKPNKLCSDITVTYNSNLPYEQKEFMDDIIVKYLKGNMFGFCMMIINCTGNCNRINTN